MKILSLVTLFLFANTLIAQSLFTEQELGLIHEADSQTIMRVWKVTSEEDLKLLRTPSDKIQITGNEAEILYFVNRLFKTVRDPNSLGVGIAAPQVGISKQIIWVQRFDKQEENFPFEYYLNPEIVEYSQETKIGGEGCLSIPDQKVEIPRSIWIVIEYDTIDGEHVQEKIEEPFTARIFQHEIDHLKGILCTDY